MKNLLSYVFDNINDYESLGMVEAHYRTINSKIDFYFLVEDTNEIIEKSEEWDKIRNLLKDKGAGDVSVGNRNTFNFGGWGFIKIKKV